MVQYICLVGCKIQPLDGYLAVCLVLTIDVYDRVQSKKLFVPMQDYLNELSKGPILQTLYEN